MSKILTTDIDEIIVGRVEPHIYAFTTETVPNYLKVGDTYRPVAVRLNEWRAYYPELVQRYEHVAKTENEKYYRDFAVHYYLESIKHLHRLQKGELKDIPYYSKEFFENAQPSDIDEAILDIERYASTVGGPYQFYTEDHLPAVEHYARVDNYDPRPNQQATIDNFMTAIAAGCRNLLMYAVMRFGKSFTSMCCAVEMGAKVVLVVSAKADVREEWKKTVESHMRFESYDFLESDNLLSNNTAISERLDAGKKVVVFLTLQDLMGDDIKEKHKELFQQNIDLLIVDETHFGARAAEYGKILLNSGLTKSQVSKELQSSDDDLDALDKGLEQIKSLNVQIKLHLSGTPYRILMGSEFEKQDIIAFYQFTDIIDAKEAWDKEHFAVENPETHRVYEEWENPYYGFPQMIRFAFNPSAQARQLIASLKENGKTAALNELFRPQSISKGSNDSFRKFTHEDEVKELLQVIDGSKEDDNLLGFLDYDKLKEGKMCRHIVCVLPFCASCDAMEELLKQNKSTFKNLCDYEIINISGVDAPSRTNDVVKELIKSFEQQGKKTISLTVNRMLTGSTIPEWDTMLFLKDVSSPQEYDQATFRLQNQYVKTYKSDEGEIRYNMKPQTLLVDFDISRMFRMQEQKSMIYNVNTEERGNDQLQERITRELEISPIIVLNKDRLTEATPTDIMDAVRKYSASRSVMDEATDIPEDCQLLSDLTIQGILENISPINSKKGLEIKPVRGDGSDVDIPDDEASTHSGQEKPQDKEPVHKPTEDEKDMNWDKRLATYYSQILFYAMLTDSPVHSLQDIIEDIPLTENNQRIAAHVGLQVRVLQYLSRRINPFILSKLDYKIENINDLMRDRSLSPIDRVELALKKFGRLSSSEIVTPSWLAEKMVGLIPPETVTEHTRFLDIAAKEGEFACAIYKLHGEKVRNNIVSLPTSPLTYEFTRKVYALLGLPIENVISEFTAYDLIKENANLYIETLRNMNFNAIVGNPPYQEEGGSGGTNDAPIFQNYATISSNLAPAYITMIMPSKWFTGGREHLLGAFRRRMLSCGRLRRMFAYSNGGSIFNDVEIKGGLCYYLEDHSYNGNCLFTHISDRGEDTRYRDLSLTDVFIRDGHLADIVSKVVRQAELDGVDMVDSIISSDTPFGIPSNPKESTKSPFNVSRTKTKNCSIKLLYNNHSSRIWEYVREADIRKNIADIHVPKVFIPKAGGTGSDSKILGEPELAPAGSVCSQTFLYAKFETEKEAENFISYLRTRFFRALVSAVKNTQDAMSGVYRFVPLQDFSEPWTDEKLYAKYGITPEEQQYIESLIKPMD